MARATAAGRLPTLDDVVVPVITACIEKYSPNRVWVAYSGGLDSTALLLGAHAALAAHKTIELCAIHINHGLATDSAKWALHCESVCKALGVAVAVRSVALPDTGNLEANARHARYAVFAEVLLAGDLLMLGHHQQDQTETLLYRLFSGRNFTPMRGHGSLGAGRFERPLLRLSQQQLADYVQLAGVNWIDDPSNQDLKLQRNFLRHQVIPRLHEVWHNLPGALSRVAASQEATQTALQHALSLLGREFNVAQLPPQPAAQRAWLRNYLEVQGEYSVSDRAIDEFLRQLSARQSAQLQGDKGQLRSFKEHIYYDLAAAAASSSHVPSAISLKPSAPVRWLHGDLYIQTAEPGQALAFAYYDDLVVRPRRGGERIRVHAQGPSQSVKTLLQSADIPPWRRKNYPLIFHGDTLVCVPGVAAVQPLSHNEVCCVAYFQSSAATSR